MDEYTTSGEVDTFNTNSVVVKLNSSGKENYYFADNCAFYIGDTKSTAAALKKMADEGTTYVKLTKNANGKVSKIIMSEDTFAENKRRTQARFIR